MNFLKIFIAGFPSKLQFPAQQNIQNSDRRGQEILGLYFSKMPGFHRIGKGISQTFEFRTSLFKSD